MASIEKFAVSPNDASPFSKAGEEGLKILLGAVALSLFAIYLAPTTEPCRRRSILLAVVHRISPQ